MEYIVSGVSVFQNEKFISADIHVKDGCIADIYGVGSYHGDISVFNFNNCVVIPGLIDVHVHLREPGYFFKETIKSGTQAAARGGFTTVCSMPNLKPVPDCMRNLQPQLDAIKNTALINVCPYGSITLGQNGALISEMEKMSKYVVGFTDDGRGVQDADIMKMAMQRAKACGKMIVAHCEDNSLLTGGYIHDGKYARFNGHRGISSESEWRQLERDLKLVRETGCSYHMCHVSTKESVYLIRQAKAEGLDVTCETAPHYLVLCDMDIKNEGRFKMNPPIRDESDREALIEGICDGTVDMIATDHAPHTAEEKSRGLKSSLMGVVGLETSFPIVYTELVKKGVITFGKLIELMHDNPAKRFNIGTELKKGQQADFAVFDLNAEYEIDPAEFLSQGKATPFEGRKVFGRCKMTAAGGQTVWTER